ncbi:MAG: SMI1/KNR4 family protein [bacterium]|nr:SMI1/KNR4 family protein [bacterium]
MNQFIEKFEALKTELIAGHIAREDNIEGMPEEEIIAHENRIGYTLPKAYRAFLSTMGKSAGTFMFDMVVFCKDLECLFEDAQEIINEFETPFALASHDYPFANYGGYHFLYFDASEGDDPPVYNFEQGQADSKKVSDSFSALMNSIANQYKHSP